MGCGVSQEKKGSSRKLTPASGVSPSRKPLSVDEGQQQPRIAAAATAEPPVRSPIVASKYKQQAEEKEKNHSVAVNAAAMLGQELLVTDESPRMSRSHHSSNHSNTLGLFSAEYKPGNSTSVAADGGNRKESVVFKELSSFTFGSSGAVAGAASMSTKDQHQREGSEVSRFSQFSQSRATERMERLLERHNSGGIISTEPADLLQNLKRRGLVAKARIANGIDENPDQFADVIALETRQYILERNTPERIRNINAYVDEIIACMSGCALVDVKSKSGSVSSPVIPFNGPQQAFPSGGGGDGDAAPGCLSPHAALPRTSADDASSTILRPVTTIIVVNGFSVTLSVKDMAPNDPGTIVEEQLSESPQTHSMTLKGRIPGAFAALRHKIAASTKENDNTEKDDMDQLLFGNNNADGKR